MLGKGARVAVSVVVLICVLALPASGRAAEECEADYCSLPVFTDAAGKARYEFTPTLVLIAESQKKTRLKDCIWQVEAVFDDGSPAEHREFDARVGLTAEHTYPAPGEYRIDLYAPEGVHAEPLEEGEAPCPAFHFIVTVVHPQPKPPVEEPPGSGTPVPGGGGQPGSGGEEGGGVVFGGPEGTDGLSRARRRTAALAPLQGRLLRP